MGYRTLRQCVEDLAATGQLAAIEEPIDAELEAAEIQRRVFRVGGPAIYFARVKGCQFPMVGNLFGTMDRVRYIFRDSLAGLKRLVSLGADPVDVLRHPRLYLRLVLVCAEHAAEKGPQRTGAGTRDYARSTAAA